MQISVLSLKRLGTIIRSSTWVLLLCLIAIVATPLKTSAQATTADLVGTVSDTTGAIIPGADITVSNKGTGEVRHAKAAADGNFTISLLQPGTYSLTVAMESFKTFAIASITLSAGDKPRVDAKLEVGASSETVTVEATTPLMQSESATVQNSVNEQAVQNVPLNGRNYVQLVQMLPGANEGPPAGLTNGTKPDDKRQSATISVNGQSDILNNNMIDGMDNNERLIGSIGLRPSVESISEIHVQSAVYTADTGRTPGAAIDIISKSGSNQFHGSLFEYFRNDIFNTNSYQFGAHNPKAELRQNQYGGSLGGPVLHDKLFFYGDYEGYNVVSVAAPNITLVPTAAQQANPSSLLPTGTTMDPVGLYYFKMYPAPNDGNTSSGTQGQYVGIGKTTQDSKVIDSRVDYNFSPNNTFFARYAYEVVHTWQPGVLPNVTMAGLTFDPSAAGAEVGGGYSPQIAHNTVLGYVHTFSPTLLLSLQAGYLRVDNNTIPPSFGKGNTTGPNINAALGQPNVNVSVAGGQGGGLGRVQITGGYGNLGGAPGGSILKDFTEAFQYQGTITYTHGAHTFKTGAQLLRRWATSVQSTNALPVWQFANLGGLLSGTYTSAQRFLNLNPPNYRWWEVGAFVQDDWHITHSLTLNLGVRYDIYTNRTDAHNRISNWSTAQSGIIVAGTTGVSNTTNVANSYGLFAPRIGMSYSVRPGFVVRGGFGIAYYPSDIASLVSLKNEPFLHSYGPFTTAQALANPAYSSMAYLAGGSIPVVASPANNPVGVVRGIAPNFRPGAAMQYDLAVQKDFFGGNVLTVNYVGVLGRHAPQGFVDLNAPPPAAYANGTAAQAARPYYSLYPGLTNISWYASEGVSSYNGVNLTLERRFKNGLSYNLNANYSRLLDNYVGLSNGAGDGYGYNVNAIAGTLPANGYANGSRYEYGNSDLDIRNHAAATLNYLLPFFKGDTSLKGKVLGGWQVNMLGGWTAGQPFTVTNSSNASGQAYGVAGSDRPNLVGPAMLPRNQRSVAKFFNTAAFQKQTTGTLGNEARNVAYGPHFRHIDLSLNKTIPIRENLHAEFRAEAFNITNTTNFATPNASLGSSTFGVITATSANYQPRVFQFALKFAF